MNDAVSANTESHKSVGFYGSDLGDFMDYYLESSDVLDGMTAGTREAKKFRESYEQYVAEAEEEGITPQPWEEVRSMVLTDIRNVRPIVNRYLLQMEVELSGD
jgi:hypothetical protein